MCASLSLAFHPQHQKPEKKWKKKQTERKNRWPFMTFSRGKRSVSRKVESDHTHLYTCLSFFLCENNSHFGSSAFKHFNHMCVCVCIHRKSHLSANDLLDYESKNFEIYERLKCSSRLIGAYKICWENQQKHNDTNKQQQGAKSTAKSQLYLFFSLSSIYCHSIVIQKKKTDRMRKMMLTKT